MLTWLGRVFSSSLGKKALMAATGLLLVGFLIVHLAGNLLLYSGRDGAAFDDDARKLDGNALLPVAEVGLVALFVAHITRAIRVSLENRESRVLAMVAAMDREGFGNCTNHFECEAACPKGISVSNIARMNREYLSAALRVPVPPA